VFQNSSGRQVAAMMIAATGMTLLAAAMAVSAIGAPFGDAILRVAIAIGSFVLANYAFQGAVSLRAAEQEALRRKLVPIKIETRNRRRRG
jgi:hypothetical protein